MTRETSCWVETLKRRKELNISTIKSSTPMERRRISNRVRIGVPRSRRISSSHDIAHPHAFVVGIAVVSWSWIPAVVIAPIRIFLAH